MFEFIDVERKFQEDFWSKHKCVLNKLSFKVEEGALCGFLGVNGAGKTTSIKALYKFITIDNGEIKYSKSLGSNWREVRDNIGYFPERPYFYPSMTGREFCRYIFNLGNGKDFNLNLKVWSERLNIAYALDQKLKNYSKGMLQRLGFVTSVISKPKLVVLDEPLSGLDPIGRADFKKAMKELNNEGVTIFFSSHIVSDVEEVCNDLVVIDSGETKFCGSISKLFDKSEKKFDEVILSASSIDSIFKYMNETDRRNSYIYGNVLAENKSNFLKEILESNTELISMNRSRETLEEIVYGDILK
jgi:ABC-2 type transport system ATP-binding protein